MNPTHLGGVMRSLLVAAVVFLSAACGPEVAPVDVSGSWEGALNTSFSCAANGGDLPKDTTYSVTQTNGAAKFASASAECDSFAAEVDASGATPKPDNCNTFGAGFTSATPGYTYSNVKLTGGSITVTTAGLDFELELSGEGKSPDNTSLGTCTGTTKGFLSKK